MNPRAKHTTKTKAEVIRELLNKVPDATCHDGLEALKAAGLKSNIAKTSSCMAAQRKYLRERGLTNNEGGASVSSLKQILKLEKELGGLDQIVQAIQTIKLIRQGV